MNSIENYNCIIDAIEKCISEIEEHPMNIKEISDYAFASSEIEYIDERGRNDIFKFMLGMTVPQYISKRILMYSYLRLLSQLEFNTDELKRIVMISSDSALFKKYKDCFGMTPKEAFDRKIAAKYEYPIRWDQLGTTSKTHFTEIIERLVEVPREEIVQDKRPYYVVGIIIGLATMIMLICFWGSFFYSKWGGKYWTFCQYVTELGDSDFYVADEAIVEINPMLRTIKAVDRDSFETFLSGKIVGIKGDEITWQWKGKEDTYVGHLDAETKTIECGEVFLGERSPNTAVRLIEENYYLESGAIWTGTFSLFGLYNQLYGDLEATYFYIDTKLGTICYFSPIDSSFYMGTIDNFSCDTLQFHMNGSPDILYLCRYNEEAYFEIDNWIDPESGELMRFYRVTKSGESQMKSFLDEMKEKLGKKEGME